MSNNTKNKDAINLNVNNINDPNSEILIIKILIVGDPGVGKSNFIYRYTKDKFSVNKLSTVGFESNIKDYKIKLEKLETRHNELDNIIKKLYEDNVSGKLTNDRFIKL